MRFTAFFGPRGRGSASVFSSFLHARSLNKCSKPCVFARFSRFLGLATDLWFFASVLTRFYSLFAKHCKNHPFLRLFLKVDTNLVGVSGLPNLKFWLFPRRLAGPNGFRELAGGVRVSKLIENHAFMRVFCVSVLSNVHCALPFFFENVTKTTRFRTFFLRFCVIQRALCSSFFFSKMLRKPRVFAYYWSSGGTVPCLLFRRFGLLTLQKRHPKLILGISRAMHGPKKLIL